MTWITVTAEDGRETWRERVARSDFDTEHFRRQLGERLAWAVADAEAGDLPDAEAGAPAARPGTSAREGAPALAA